MRFVILIVIITAAVGVGLAMLWVAGNQQPAPVQPAALAPAPGNAQVATVDVLVARQDIPVGTQLTETLVDRQPWPRNLVLDGFLTADAATKTVGMITRADFKAREPLIASKLSSPSDASFLAGALGKGMRAVTVAVDPISGVAGYVLPGDRVDILLSHGIGLQALPQQQNEPAGLGQGSAAAAEVLLPDVKVLAVNTRRPSQSEPPRGGLIPQVQDVEAPSNVTLELSQEAAKKIRLSEKNGTLSLALRSVLDKDDAEVGAPVTLMDITRIVGERKAPEVRASAASRPDNVQIIRGGINAVAQ